MLPSLLTYQRLFYENFDFKLSTNMTQHQEKSVWRFGVLDSLKQNVIRGRYQKITPLAVIMQKRLHDSSSIFETSLHLVLLFFSS